MTSWITNLSRNNTTNTETTAYVVLARVQALVRSNKGELKEASYNRVCRMNNHTISMDYKKNIMLQLKNSTCEKYTYRARP